MKHYELLTHCLLCQRATPRIQSFIIIEFRNAEFKLHVCNNCRIKYPIQEVWNKILTTKFEKAKK